MFVRIDAASSGGRVLRRTRFLATAGSLAVALGAAPAMAQNPPAAALAVAAQNPPVQPDAGQVTTGPTKSAGTSSETVNIPGGKPQVPTDPLSGEPVTEASGTGDIVVTGSAHRARRL